MTPPVLYSTNPSLKLFLQEKYQKDIHYVWCSAVFDPSKLSRYRVASRLGTTSTPVDIYRGLRKEIQTRDKHGYKIKEQRVNYTRRARDWRTAGHINDDQLKEILYTTKTAELTDFNPLIYVIPYDMVKTRLIHVPPQERADPLSDEWKIADLARHEFDIIEGID